MKKKLLTGIISVTVVSFLTLGSVSASAISPTACPPGPGPHDNCLERP